MFHCSKCSTILTLDYKYTGAFYNDNVVNILDENNDILYNELPNCVVYVCRRCGNKQLIDLNALINSIKMNACKIVLNSRLDLVYKSIDRASVDEASGVSFCGQCPGVVDDSGYCYNDVIKQCPVRKIIDDEEYFTKCGEYKK